MSTRCNIEIYDGIEEPYIGAMLYHHSDGYPDFMQNKLELFLKATYEYLKEAGHPYWWDSERVAACLIALSIEDYQIPLKPFSTDRDKKYSMESRRPYSTDRDKKYSMESRRPYRPNGGVPVFQPCLQRHGDIRYVWKVYLGEPGEFKILHERV